MEAAGWTLPPQLPLELCSPQPSPLVTTAAAAVKQERLHSPVPVRISPLPSTGIAGAGGWSLPALSHDGSGGSVESPASHPPLAPETSAASSCSHLQTATQSGPSASQDNSTALGAKTEIKTERKFGRSFISGSKRPLIDEPMPRRLILQRRPSNANFYPNESPPPLPPGFAWCPEFQRISAPLRRIAARAGFSRKIKHASLFTGAFSEYHGFQAVSCVLVFVWSINAV